MVTVLSFRPVFVGRLFVGIACLGLRVVFLAVADGAFYILWRGGICRRGGFAFCGGALFGRQFEVGGRGWQCFLRVHLSRTFVATLCLCPGVVITSY